MCPQEFMYSIPERIRDDYVHICDICFLDINDESKMIVNAHCHHVFHESCLADHSCIRTNVCPVDGCIYFLDIYL